MTPAVEMLREAGTTHRVVTYDHDPATDSYGSEAAVALDLDPQVVFKTLLVEVLPHDETVVAVVPVTGRLDLKSLARAAEAKKAQMVDPTTAERLTGYVVGGISPLGQRKRLRTFIDDTARRYSTIHVSGGRRGLEIELSATDLAEAVDATFHRIATAPAP